MRIILEWRSPPTYTNASEYIRAVFAPITHKIRIVNVSTQASTSTHTMFSQPTFINVDYDTQGLAAATDNIETLVRDAVSLCGDLTLISVEPPPAMQIIRAIQLLDGSTYTVDPVFATYVARNPDYRQTLLTRNVETVDIECQRLLPNTLRYSGRMATRSSNTGVNPSNPYYLFATACQNVLAQDLATSNNIVAIHMAINAGVPRITLQSRQPMAATAAAATTTSASESAPATAPRPGK